MNNGEGYRKARFRVSEPEGGWPSSFGVVTACNPHGKLIPKSRNEGRTAELEMELLEAGLVMFPVTGYDLDSAHEEEGFGVICGKDEILRLGRKWEQEAVFWVEKGRVWLLSCAVGGEKIDLRPLLEMVWSQPCPCCGEAMREGRASLEYTWGGFLFAGVSWLTLFFRGRGGKRLPVLGATDSSSALFCNGCGTLVVRGEDVRTRASG